MRVGGRRDDGDVGATRVCQKTDRYAGEICQNAPRLDQVGRPYGVEAGRREDGEVGATR
jgi:hypothetical protein